jgi:pimeloyl-ACP methyl ester carboxylesterase
VEFNEKQLNLGHIHGGPGMNSYPEKDLLEDILIDHNFKPHFFHQPSSFRPEGTSPEIDRAYPQLVESVMNFIIQNNIDILVAHSFGMWPTLEAMNNLDKRNIPLVILAPTLDLVECDRNLMKIVLGDFQVKGDERAEEIRRYINSGEKIFDEYFEQGYKMALEDPDLFQNHFVNKRLMMDYLLYFARPESQIDAEMMFATRKCPIDIEMLLGQEMTNLTLIYGALDRIVSYKSRMAVDKDILKAKESIVFKNSGHFPHIEETLKFIEVLKSSVQRV